MIKKISIDRSSANDTSFGIVFFVLEDRILFVCVKGLSWWEFVDKFEVFSLDII